jgi:predicted GH43/DUF377 family glycosyl hydrolase
VHNNSVPIVRTPLVLAPDQSRVLLRPFVPGTPEKIARIVASVMAIPEDRVRPLLDDVYREFSSRHQDIEATFRKRFEQISRTLPHAAEPSRARKLLIGSYFMAEYSLESAALFNPSIAPHPDQSGLQEGDLRFVLSLRAIGEGHISSITFRAGVVHADGAVEVCAAAGFLGEPTQIPNPLYERALFLRKLGEMGLGGDFSRRLVDRLGDWFSLEALRAALAEEKIRHRDGMTASNQQESAGMWTLACSNYEVQFRPDQELSERVLFPATPTQSNGIEDARFVRFQNDDGTLMYYATFTAYDGRAIMPELVETSDFLRFRFISLNGPAAQNKGMALFPRKIDGRYAMLSRQDNENIFLMFSDNVHFWNHRMLLLKPAFPWEIVQIGNCGSPIETDAGWLVLSHGVGPVRKYCIGAFLLDRNDPSKVIGRLREPLISPSPREREGYVPNVVYTCGAMLHGEQLIIPFGLADYATGFATAKVGDILAAME